MFPIDDLESMPVYSLMKRTLSSLTSQTLAQLRMSDQYARRQTHAGELG